MPRSRNPDNYPPHYAQLLSAARGRREGILIEFDSVSEMNRTKNNLYAYINALDRQESDAALPYNDRLAPGFRQIALQMRGKNLLLIDKVFDAGVQAISRTLENLGQTAPVIQTSDEVRAAAAADIAAHEDDSPPTPDPVESTPAKEPVSMDDVISTLFQPTPKEGS